MKFRFSPGRQADRRVPPRDDPVFVDRAGRTALHYAVSDSPVGMNHTAALRDERLREEHFRISNAFRVQNTTRLLALGADPNAADEVGMTPLHFAAHGESIDVVELLVSAGADVNAVSEDDRTPLYQAVRNTTGARAVIVAALLTRGAEPTLGGRVRKFLARSGDEQLAAILAEHGHDFGPERADDRFT